MKRLAILLGVLAGTGVLIAGAIAATRPFATVSARGPRPPIKLKGPARTSTSQVATFRWSRADTRTSGFRCRLDRGRFTRCKSGITYKQLRQGTHTFTLIALDAAGHRSAAAKGNTKSSPPSWSWTVAKAPSISGSVPAPPNPGAAPVKGNQTIPFTKPTDKSFGEGSTTLAASAPSGLQVSFSSKTTSVCADSGPNGEKVNFLATGTCTIEATQAGNANWNAATPVEQSFTIAKGNQTITFTTPTEKRLDQIPIPLTATTTSGLPVSFESKTTSICTTSGSGGETVTFLATGTCTIEAIQAGNANWNAAPAVERSFTVAKGNQTIAFAKPANKSFGEDSTTIAATATSGLPVGFESKTTSVCATSGIAGETITFLANGTCTIRATQDGDSNWNAAPAVEQSFAIGKGTQTITFDKPADKSFGEGSTTVAATAISGLAVGFNSKTTGVCTVAGPSGEKVTFVAAGACTIEATQAGDSDWDAATPVAQSFTIAKGNQTIAFNAPTEKRLDQGPVTVTATATSGLAVTFESKTLSVCTASGATGATVTLHTTGTCTIAANQGGEANWNAAAPVEQSFTVAKGNQTIAFEGLPASKRLDEGPIAVKAKATSGLTVTFESQTASVCTTSGASGETVSFVAAGTCTIKASQAGSSEWDPTTEEQSFTIAKGNQTIAFAKPPSASFNEGSTTVEATASSGLTVTFESKTTGICTTSGTSGENITFHNAGTCTIEATQAGDTNWNAATAVERSFTIAKGNQTIAFAELPGKSFSEGSTILAATASSGLLVTFESRTTSTCTVSGSGGEKVSFVAAGTCTIKANQAGSSNWNAATSIEESFTIAKGSQTITFNAPTEKRLDQSPIAVTATTSSGLSVSLNSKTTGVCTIAGETVTFHAAGTCTLEATQSGNSNWNVAPPVEQSFTVAKGNQTIAFNAPTEKHLDQGPVTLEANASSGLTVSFESETTSVCTTSGTSGETVTFHTKGTCTIEATQAGNANWNSAPVVEHSFTIAKGNQTIAFSAPTEKRLDQSPVTVTATASSGLAVSFNSKTMGVCTTSGTLGETVTLHTAGTCTIEATQAGNSNWNVAPAVERSFTIAKGNQTITFNEPPGKLFGEGSTTLTATASSTLPVTFESKTTAICTVSGSGGEKVSFVTTGTCTIKANQVGSANWNAATAVEQSFAITSTAMTLTALAPPTVSAGEGTSRVTVSPDGKNVYATNRGGGGKTVSQYSRNTETGKLTALVPATVATGEEPEGIVASSDGKSVYVANRESDSISEYSRNTVTGALTAQTTIGAGEGPIGLAITPDGKQVYAANSTSANVSQFSRNTTTGELKALAKATVGAGANAHGIVVSADSKNVYVANYGEDTVSEYARNETSGELTVLGTAEGGSNPHDLAISPDGASVYVADSTDPGEVLEMTRNAETGLLTALVTIEAGEFTECIVVSPDGNSVYATNEVSGNVSQYSRNTGTGGLTALTPPAIGAGLAPEGIAVSADSKSVYVANHESGSVSQYSR